MLFRSWLTLGRDPPWYWVRRSCCSFWNWTWKQRDFKNVQQNLKETVFCRTLQKRIPSFDFLFYLNDHNLQVSRAFWGLFHLGFVWRYGLTQPRMVSSSLCSSGSWSSCLYLLSGGITGVHHHSLAFYFLVFFNFFMSFRKNLRIFQKSYTRWCIGIQTQYLTIKTFLKGN